MAYKDMNSYIYYSITIVLFIMEMTIACLTTNIGLVLDFASAFSITFLAFWFPSFYYLKAEKKYECEQNSLMHKTSIILIFVGIFNCAISLFSAFYSIFTE